MGQKLKARHLVTPSDRLVISNVSPTIPHDTLKTTLEGLGLKLLSPITFLRIGATDPAYSHIMSFRRQVYITPLESLTLAESLEITHDNLSYRIFLSLDSQKCFNCKLSGHVVANCPTLQNQKSPIQTNTINNDDPQTSHEQTKPTTTFSQPNPIDLLSTQSNLTVNTPTAEVGDISQKTTTTLPNSTNKRFLSSESSPEASTMTKPAFSTSENPKKKQTLPSAPLLSTPSQKKQPAI